MGHWARTHTPLQQAPSQASPSFPSSVCVDSDSGEQTEEQSSVVLVNYNYN